MQDRRGLLRAGAYLSAAGLVTGLTGQDMVRASPRAPSAPLLKPPGEPDWQKLRRELSPAGRLYRPGDEGYRSLALPWNLRYEDKRPAGIVSCATTRDVQVALRWARANEMPLAPRAGGHNYAGYSTTPGLLISVRPMNKVIRGQGDRLRIGGGATNGDVAQAGDGKTNLYVPGGRCLGVGMAGLTLGGGLGFNDRKWGLSCDHLVETEVVLADGTLVRANGTEGEELFWACRGGAGGNFGINTSFVFDAVDVSRRHATVFALTFGPHDGVKVMEIVQNDLLAKDHGNDLDVRVEFGNPGTGPGNAEIAVLGQYLGDEAELRAKLSPLLSLGPTKQSIEQLGFWTAQKRLSMQSEHEAVASKSLVPDRWLAPDTVAAIVDWILRWEPGVRGNTGYVTFFAMGGAIKTRAPGETAFPHRNATFVIDVGTSWQPGASAEIVQRLLAQTRTVYGRLSKDLKTSAAYVNFPDPDLADWPTAYYGNNYGKLTRIKSHYDPDWIFRYDQGIRPG